MPTVVGDTSCMIDLRKAGLLEAVLRLPYRFVMPDRLFDDEWLSLTDSEKAALRSEGLQVVDLSGDLVRQAQRYFNQYPALKLNDCFALALAEDMENSILLTGGLQLRRVAQQSSIAVHGVLWAFDEMETSGMVSPHVLYGALRLWEEDDLVFLPPGEVKRRLRRLSRLQ